ncbi:hypothetical protein D3C72_1273530 [compost metagenome]
MRSSDGVGSWATPSNTMVCVGCVSTTVWLVALLAKAERPSAARMATGNWLPSAPTRPSVTGITKGSLLGCPAVAGQCCDRVSV